MPKDLSNTITTALSSEEQIPIMLIELEISDTWYKYTNIDIDFTPRDNPYGDFLTTETSASGTYSSRGFSVGTITFSQSSIVNEAKLVLDNIDSQMTSLFNGPSVQDSNTRVYYGLIDNNHTSYLKCLYTLFVGYIDSYEVDEEKLYINIGSPFARWDKSSTNYHSSSCRYKVFKGSRCGYSGAFTTCDGSYAQCVERGNTANFGGFRWLPSIEGRIIHWGQFHEKELS